MRGGRLAAVPHDRVEDAHRRPGVSPKNRGRVASRPSDAERVRVVDDEHVALRVDLGHVPALASAAAETLALPDRVVREPAVLADDRRRVQSTIGPRRTATGTRSATTSPGRLPFTDEADLDRVSTVGVREAERTRAVSRTASLLSISPSGKCARSAPARPIAYRT